MGLNLLDDGSLLRRLIAVCVAFDWEAALLDQLQPLREREVRPPEESPETCQLRLAVVVFLSALIPSEKRFIGGTNSPSLTSLSRKIQ